MREVDIENLDARIAELQWIDMGEKVGKLILHPLTSNLFAFIGGVASYMRIYRKESEPRRLAALGEKLRISISV